MRPPQTPPKNEFASLTKCSIGRGAVAPSQTLPTEAPPATPTPSTVGKRTSAKPKDGLQGEALHQPCPPEQPVALDPGRPAGGQSRGSPSVLLALKPR